MIKLDNRPPVTPDEALSIVNEKFVETMDYAINVQQHIKGIQQLKW